MRTRIKVTDLTIEQWNFLCSNLPEARQFESDAIRMCVELELTGQVDPIHVEMLPREFVALIEKVGQIDRGFTGPAYDSVAPGEIGVSQSDDIGRVG